MANQIVVSAGAKVRNLDGVLTGTSGVVNSLPINASNGIPQLDVNGKILVSQLPNSVMEYQGVWNANTNTPTLTNGGAFNQGDVYLCNVAGTTNFGAGPISFIVGDQAIYSGTIWQKAGGATGTVTSVGITESGDSLNITGSPITTSGTINIGFNGTNLQYVNGAGNLTTFPTLITSIGLSMPSAFSVANSPLTANGTIAVTGAGYASQYIRGDGTLADFPSSGGGGSSVSYYLNGGTSQGTIGGTTYYEMSKTADTGTGVDFAKSGDGFIVAFLTDANDPAQLNIPAGNWNYEIYASMSANGGTPQMYAELYKYDGTTFTLISTSTNEILYDGVNLNLYTFGMTVPATTLTLTDRLAIKLYATNSGGKTTTVHTQDSHLCQVITTFSTGITALNGLTAQVQYFQVGTSGTDFNISSSTATHTFNLPTASATNRGALSSADWSTFNGKENTLTFYSPLVKSGSSVTIPPATSIANGYLTSTDWSTFNSKQAALSGTGFVKISGTTISYDNSTYYLASNPSAFISLTALSAGVGISYNNTTGVITNSAPDQTVALTASTGISVTGTYPNFTITNTSPSSGGTVTSVAALTIGTSGTDLSSSVANSTTTPVITLNVPTASATNRGALSSADWTTFNNKQSALTNPVTGTGNNNYLAKFTSTGSTIGNSAFYDGGGFGGFNSTGLGARTFIIQAATSRPLAIELVENANVHAVYVRPNNSGYNLISSNYISGGVYIPLALSGRESSSDLVLWTNGNTSIGQSTDLGYKLDVNGTGRFSGNTYIQPNVSSNDVGLYIQNNSTDGYGSSIGLGLYGYNTSAYFNPLRIESSYAGYGIVIFYVKSQSYSTQIAALNFLCSTGAATFSSSVTAANLVLNTDGVYLKNRASNVNATQFQTWHNSSDTRRGYFGYGEGGANNFYLVNEQSANMYIGTNGSYNLTISSSGAATFSSSIYVSSTATIAYNGISGDFGAGYTIGMGVGYSSSVAKGINMGWNTTYDMGFIGTVHNGTAWKSLTLCPVGGSVYIGITGNNYIYAGAFYEGSDKRLKQIIEDDYKAVGVESVKARLYTKEGKLEIGYYAQDLESILPSAVSKNDAGFLSLSYTQVHTAKIAIIEDEVDILKRRVTELESKLQKYEA